MSGFRLRIALAIALAMVLAVIPAVHAQYPNKVIHIVSPAPPAGSTDIIARLVAPGLQSGLRQTVIVENRGGAGGYLGSEYVAKSPADGYTLLIGGAFSTITASLHKTPGYDPRRDLVPVAIFASVPNVLIAGPRLQANSVAELITAAKAKPGKLNMGSNGVGTTLHLAGELFQLRTDTSLVHVPYRGWADCVAALLNGEVDLMFDNTSSSLPNVRAGKTRALAVAGKERHRSLPDVPTLAELGIKDAEVISWFGLMTPAGTPRPAIDALDTTLKAMAQTAEFRRGISEQGLDVTYLDAAEAVGFWNSEIDRWGAVIKASGLSP
jgi:tripartite-type tricarboxylate transporter receptor subunit TctC